MAIPNWLQDALTDLRFGVRQLSRAPGFSAVTILSLALGIGANTAIFTLLNAVAFQPLPVRQPDELVLLGQADRVGVVAGQVGAFSLYSWDLYQQLRGVDVFDDLCAFQSEASQVSVRRNGWRTTQSTPAKLVSGNYFETLGVNALLGRPIVPSDDAPSAAPVAVMSFAYWTRALNNDPSVVGSVVDVNGVPVTIVGVAPERFFGETLQADPPSLWLPASVDRQLNPTSVITDDPDAHFTMLMARRKSGVSDAEAAARLTATLRAWLLSREGTAPTEDRQREIAQSRVELKSGAAGVAALESSHSQMFVMLLGIGMAVLLITCVNIASLLMARASARSGETAVRFALGAERGRLIRQSFTESLLLALLGGALALIVAAAGTELLLRLFFVSGYVPIETTPDLTVIGFNFGLSFFVAVLFGLLPAFRSATVLTPDLARMSRSVKSPGSSLRRMSIGNVLVIAQIAIAVIVLSGSGLLVRSLLNLVQQEFGFDREHVLIADVDLSLARYEYPRLAPVYSQLLDRLHATPGVQSASLSFYSPFNGCCWTFSIGVEGRTPKPGERLLAILNRVSPRHFETLGTRLLLGRAFDARDTPTAPAVAVVNEAFVSRFLPEGNPIGKRFGVGGVDEARDLEIVGVVENAKYGRPRRDLMPMAFLPLLQLKAEATPASAEYKSNFVNVIEVRATGDPAAIAGRLRDELAEVDAAIPLLRVETLSAHLDRAVSTERAIARLAVFFGGVALVLACVGLYGLTAYTIQRRTNEIGVRMALGASRGSVVAALMRQAALQGVLGVVIGVPAALMTTGLIATQLYQVDPKSPANMAIVIGAIGLCVAVAAYVPARRAAGMDAAKTLRQT